jgi:regulator of protease activity HflC (stomatin/prohibitin superfamily)
MRPMSRISAHTVLMMNPTMRCIAWRPTVRMLSMLSMFSNYENDLARWPQQHRNTVLNVCPQGKTMVVERLGKLYGIKEGGWFLAIPILDNIRFVIDMRERALSIAPQPAITKDNVHVNVSGNLYCQFVDAEKAAYGSNNPLYAVRQHAQASMRAAIGEMELDEILHARARLNAFIKLTLQESAHSWGLDIKRYEITEVTPDKFITEAMDKQAAAERERRKKVLDAEGSKRSAELESEGNKVRMKNESEGTLIKVTNEAEAKKVLMILEAEGEAQAIQNKAMAHATAIKIIAEALTLPNGAEAAQLAVAREYISMYGQMGLQSNTMIFNDRPADLNALLAQAGAVLKSQSKESK